MFQPTSRGGVATPATQGLPMNELPTNTVINAMEVKFVAVEYGDANGRKTLEVLLELGGEYYTPPNSQQWAAALKGVSKWLREGIKKKLPTGASKAADSVEIVTEE